MVRKDQADRAREILKDIELSYSYFSIGLRKSGLYRETIDTPAMNSYFLQ